MYCGSIFCTGGNKYPITGLKAQLLTMTGEICNIVGERSEEEILNMVPTGTKCGQNKVSVLKCFVCIVFFSTCCFWFYICAGLVLIFPGLL